ncbi:hypothetical protein BDV93DRAFT_214739 [Ceratobasidium sp. AG-I]|nr:hypothetical protein BDV93DRAFT_214739 [Ceratobasidium sp. AG-I]
MSYDETPSKPTQKLPNIGLGFKNQQTPMAKRLASKSMTNLGSAMRGVVLTDSGTVVPTPIRGGADPTVSPSNPLFDDRTLNAPIPAPQLTDAIPIAPLERSASESDAPRLPRLARRSTVGPAARPISVPSGSGSVNSWASAPAPIYDMADEENLPSPFIKRGKADAVKSKKVPGLLQLATGNAAKAGASSSTRTGAGASLRSGTKASLLRAVKAGESVTRTLTSKR